MTHESTQTELIDVKPGAIVPDTYELGGYKRSWALPIVTVLCLLAVLGVGFTHIIYQQDRVERLISQNKEKDQAINSLIDENKAANENARSLYDQLLKLGEKPQGTNPTVYTPGAQGNAGRDGRDATDEQVLRAVERYCLVGVCEGKPGADSTVPGPQGPVGVRGAQGEPGQAGAPGATGAQGAPGVGIQSIACLEDGNWQFTMTNSTVLVVPGPCRASLLGNGNGDGNN